MTEDALYLAALERTDPADRRQFLDSACGTDADLRRRLDERLAAADADQNRPSSPAFDETRTGPHHAATADYRPAAQPETVIDDRYKLLERIGEGGMGEVWVAKQTKPVQRKVALKLIKAGMDSKSVLGRFEAERQALAMMDHPSIAKVLDGGLTDTGRPFFVMELVNGQPLTKFCDEARLTPRERLELFVPVCHAIQHAHQKGIVHRDLKPTNILVTLYDGRPVPKVIDFGVAKATGGRLTEETLSTQFGAVVGTFEYMAPEQAGFSALDVDTRADVYSLGVILYELLTGLRPFEGSRLRKAAIDELFRILREEEPPRPSTKLSTDSSLPSAAAARRTDPKKLASLMRGELDWIVMKCLEKDRSRRYDTVAALARDIERYLADEPVEARPPSTRYKLRKFVRRNQGRVVAGALVLLALVAGVVGTTVGLIEARGQRDAARRAEQQAEADRAQAVGDRQLAVAESKRAELESERAKAAEFEQGKALEQARVALIRSDGLRLASESSNVRATDPGLALLLGLEGVRRYPHHLTFAALYDAAGDLREKKAIPTGTSGVKGLRLRPDGSKVLLYADARWERGTVILDLATGGQVSQWRGLPTAVTDTDWSPDGTRAVSLLGGPITVAFTDGRKPEQATFTDRVAYVWDTATGRDVLHLHRHDDRIVSARYDREGTRILTASWDGTARIWSAASGKELHVLRGHRLALLTAIFSPDGKRVLTVSSQEERWSSQYRELSGRPKPDREPGTDPGVTTRPFRATSTTVGGGSSTGGRAEQPVARLWDADTGKQVGELRLSANSARNIFGWNRPHVAAFSPDGSRIAIGFNDDLIGVWDAAGGDERAALSGHRGQVLTLAFSPDGSELASAGSTSTVFLWDVATGRPARRFEAPGSGQINAVAFSADGRRIVAGGSDRAARVWHVSTGRELAAFRGHAGPVTAAQFLPDGETVVTVAESTLHLWSVAPAPPVPTLLFEPDPPSGRLATLLGKGPARHTGPITALTFTPDSRSIYTGSNDRTIRRWDAATGRQTAEVATTLRGPVRSFAVGAGDVLYAATDLTHAYFESERQESRDTFLSMVHRWDPATRKIERFLKGQKTGVDYMELSKDGQRMLLAMPSGELMYRPGARNPLEYQFGHFGQQGGTTVWDVATGERLCTVADTDKQSADLSRPRLSPDGSMVLQADQERHALALYDARTGRLVRKLATPKEPSSGDWGAAEFSPNGRLIAAQRFGSWEVWFWKAETGESLGAFESPPPTGTWTSHQQMCFSPDSKRLAYALDRTVYIADVATRRQVGELRGHEAAVTALVYSPDGTRLLTGSEDKSAALWDVEATRLLAVYRGHQGAVKFIAYSPDGTRVATATESEPMVRVWPLDVVPVFDRRKPRELTTAERVRYELPPVVAGK